VSSVVVSLLHSLRFVVQSRASLHLEIIALRHQLGVVNRSRRPRLRFTAADRRLWVWLSRSWCGWRSAAHIVKPETVIAWHRRGFRLFWTWKSRLGRRCATRRSCPDWRDVHHESAVGCASDSRGAPEVGDRGESIQRGQVHAPASSSAVTNLAHVSDESREPDHGRRPFCGAIGHLPTTLRTHHPRP
jgi:hypothetical protein